MGEREKVTAHDNTMMMLKNAPLGSTIYILSFPFKTQSKTMNNQLENRRSKVLRLMQLALSDRNVMKYSQGRFLLSQIDSRINAQVQTRQLFINQLRQAV